MGERLLAGRPLLTAVLYVTLGIFPLFLTSSQILSLDAELGFTVARLGIATAMHFGVAAIAAQTIGRTVARIGAQNGIRVGATLATTAGLVAIVSTTWWPLLLVAALAGLANGFLQVSTNVFLAVDVEFRRQGLSFGAKQSAVPLANALAGVLLPIVGVSLGWRWPFGLAAGVSLLSILIAPPLINDPPERPKGENERATPLSTSLKWLGVGGVCGGAAGNSLALFFVPSAVNAGVTESTAGIFLAASAGLVFVLRISVGWIADRKRSSGHREMIILLTIGTVGSFMLAATASTALFMISMPLAMVGAWGWPALAYFTVVRIHPEAPARATGFVLATNLTGTVLGPLAVGLLTDREMFTTAFTLVAVLSVAGATAMYMSYRAYRTMQVLTSDQSN